MGEETMAMKDQLIATFLDLGETVVRAAPKVLLALVLIVVLLIVAKIVEKLARAILTRLRLEVVLEKLGLDETLKRFGLTQSPAHLLSRVIYFLLLFLFARTAADALGLEPVSQALGSFLAYIPHVVAAALILLLGTAAGNFAGAAVARAARDSGIDYASSLGSLVYALVLFVAGIMALGQLKIDTDIVRIVTVGVLTALALAFGLSLGLGTREVTRNIIAGFYARKVFQIGEEIEIRGERGTLKAITPTQTLLQRDERTIAVANSVYLDDVVRQ